MRYGAFMNAVAIVLGAAAGLIVGTRINEKIKETMIKGIAVCTMFIGIAGCLAKMLTYSDGAFSTQGSVMIICCMALGGLIGEAVKIEDGLERFGNFLKVKSGNAKDGGFINAFVTTTLVVGIGAMAVVGSITDGLTGDYSILLIKSLLDFIYVMILASGLGKGSAFAAVPVLIFEGGLTLLAQFLAPYIVDEAVNNLSQVGSVMIFIVGANIIWPKTFRPGNYLPALVLAVLWTLFNLPMM